MTPTYQFYLREKYKEVLLKLLAEMGIKKDGSVSTPLAEEV